MPDQLKVYFVAGTELRTPGAGVESAPASSVEVVKLPDVERAIDEKVDALRWAEIGRRALHRLITSLPGYLPDEPLHVAIMRLVEEVEHLRKVREEDEVVIDAEVVAPTVSATLRQWIEEELVDLRNHVGHSRPDSPERPKAEAERDALQRVANRIDEEAA